MICSNCGKEINDSGIASALQEYPYQTPVAVVCPYCGAQVPLRQGYAAAPMQQGYTQQMHTASPMYQQRMSPSMYSQFTPNWAAIAGFIFAFIMPIIGIICSIIGYKKAVRFGTPHKGMSIAGIIISILNMVVVLIVFLAFFVPLLSALPS